MRRSNTYSCWKEEGGSKFVLQYHEKNLHENKQCKKIEPGCIKMRKTNKIQVLILRLGSTSSTFLGHAKKSIRPSITRIHRRYRIKLTKCAKKATSSGSKNVFLRQSTRATTTCGPYNLWKPDTRISDSNEKHGEHRRQDNADDECQKYE